MVSVASRKRKWVLAAGLLLALGALAAAAVLLVERRSSNSDVAAAREFEGFPLYWVGERFEKWELRAIDLPGPAGFATLIYGDCEIEDPDGFFGPEGGSCTPPLSIQVSPLCFHLGDVARAPIWKRRSVRGAPVGSSDSAPVLFTRGAQVKVYRGQGSDAGLAMRALHALRSLNEVPPVIDSSSPIPGPDRRILAGSLPCRDSRPGTALIEENRGTYRNVGIDSTAEEVRRTLGNREWASSSGPAIPRSPCRPKILRYEDVSFMFCSRRVFAFVVTRRRARTQAGLGIADSLDTARSLYPGLHCGQAGAAGAAGRRAFCVGRMRPRRSFRLAGDPIRSITFSSMGFEGDRS